MSVAPTPALREPLRWVMRWPGVAFAGLLWILFSIDFDVLSISSESDSRVQFTLVQKFFGADVNAFGYQFGLAVFETPFYAFGRILSRLGLRTIGGVPSGEALIAIGSMLITLGALLLTARLVSDLGLPLPGFAAFTATFGMPLFYYGTWVPGKTHAWDTFLFAGALVLLLRYVRSDFSDVRLVVVLGAILGFAATVRYTSASECAVLALSLLALRRFRHAFVLVAVAVAVWGLVYLAPLAVGAHLTGGGYGANVLALDPLGPLKMLFTNHRGLFVWSPISVIGLVGYVFVLRRSMNPDRRFLVIAALMGLGILLSYASVPFWDGTWSFSQRFLTPLVPLVGVGVAGLAQTSRSWALTLGTIATAWTVFLALNLQLVGPPHNDYSTIRGGASDVALQVSREHVSLGAYSWAIRHRSRLWP